MTRNSKVRVLPNKPDGSPHPHAGKEGVVTELFTLVGPARAMLKIAPGYEGAGNYIVVSLGSLEPLKAGA